MAICTGNPHQVEERSLQEELQRGGLLCPIEYANELNVYYLCIESNKLLNFIYIVYNHD